VNRRSRLKLLRHFLTTDCFRDDDRWLMMGQGQGRRIVNCIAPKGSRPWRTNSQISKESDA
jgi:hypothetical protein